LIIAVRVVLVLRQAASGHLLLLAYPLVDHLVHGRFHVRGRYPFARR
jgi:hypothetical protein